MPPPLLATQHVQRSYLGEHCLALADVSLDIPHGDYLAIMGPSGSGKSTLLHLLCGLDQPTAGRVLFEGRQPANARQWTRLRATRIGFVFQSFNLLPTLTARQNIEIPMFGILPSATERRQRADELLDLVGLQNRAHHRPSQLSGGEKQRVAIARALANRPDVILADELTGNLDSSTASAVMDLMEDIRRQWNGALVIVTHDESVAARAHRVCRLRDGAIVSDHAPVGRAPCASGT